jgi:hypothetical protein
VLLPDFEGKNSLTNNFIDFNREYDKVNMILNIIYGLILTLIKGERK